MFQRMFPYYMSADIRRSLKFYCTGLGLQFKDAVDAQQNTVEDFDQAMGLEGLLFACVKNSDNLTIGFEAREAFEETLGIPKNTAIVPGMTLYIEVDDIKEMQRRTEALGAEVILALRDSWYGMREFAIKDPDGHFLCFGQAITEKADNDG